MENLFTTKARRAQRNQKIFVSSNSFASFRFPSCSSFPSWKTKAPKKKISGQRIFFQRFPFFHPDCTVGSGFAPDHAIADFLLWLAGLPATRRLTADRELGQLAALTRPRRIWI
jgi:hypothetical protein